MPQTPTSETPVVDTTDRDQVLAQMVARHGSAIGSAVIDEAASKTVDKYGTPQVVNDPFYTYTWPDGTALTISGAGQVYKLDEKPPLKTAGGWTEIRDVGNQVWGTDPADGKFKAIPGVPDLGRLKGFTQLVPIPQPDGTKLYYGIDPADGTFKQVPGLPTLPPDKQTHADIKDAAGNTYIWDASLNGGAGGFRAAPGLPTSAVPIEGAQRQIVQNGQYVNQVYTSGQWVDKSLGGPATPGAATEGLTRQVVQNGQYVQQQFQHGEWVPLKIIGPATPGAAQENATRQVVENGRNVTQTFLNGTWTTTGLGTSAIPGAPQENATRQVVQNGRYVTETFQNGEWTPTGVGASAIPGTPQEGAKRDAIQNGYRTTQTYTGGEWVTTDIGARAIPGTATQVTAPSNQAFISTLQDGTVTSVPNPAYMPQTQAEVAARVAQLQQTAQQKRDELSKQVQAGSLSQADAASQFDQWWNQNVESQKGALVAAQRTASLAEQRQQDEQQRANLATAQTAGAQAITAQQAMLPYRVGPGYGAAVNQIAQSYATGKAPSNLDIGSAVMYRMPDLNQVAQQATAQALAHISPTAAQIATGQPTPSLAGMAPNIDVNQMLQQTNYAPGGVPLPTPQPPPVQPGIAPSPAVPPPPPGSPGLPDWYAAWQQRQAADAAQQQAAAGIYGNYVPGF